jgi:hypothetical protein
LYANTAEFIEMMEGLSTCLPFDEERQDSSTTMKKRIKKSLHFSPQIKVHSIPRIYDYSEEEAKKICFYTVNEIRTIKAECAATVRKVLEEQKHLHTDTECFRGLEYRTPDGMRKRIWNKQTALDAVFDKQDTLWAFERIDEESIALAYQKYSVSCQEAAHQLGLQDERFIQQLEKNRERSSRLRLSRRVVEISVDFEKSPLRRTLIGSSAA